jgi:hypothetical protein
MDRSTPVIAFYDRKCNSGVNPSEAVSKSWGPPVREASNTAVIYELAWLSPGDLHGVERCANSCADFKPVLDGFSGLLDEPNSLVGMQGQRSS